ncbi:MAG: light-harvesting protein [Betaproteobacteria bacterium]|nr:light-harvesting protein [Betaproteobacteria bacterium]
MRVCKAQICKRQASMQSMPRRASGSAGLRVRVHWSPVFERRSIPLCRISVDFLEGFNMWRYWRLIDPRKAIVATGIWMAALAFMIHLVVLSLSLIHI